MAVSGMDFLLILELLSLYLYRSFDWRGVCAGSKFLRFELLNSMAPLLLPGRVFLRDRKYFQVSSEQVPSRSAMASNTSSSVLPANRGLPSSSSARMHPADQTSTAVP
jgi:hypothetical protein